MIFLLCPTSHKPCLFSKLLAGSKVNDVDKHHQTALHMAVAKNSPSIVSVLLENKVEPDAVDEQGNNGNMSPSAFCVMSGKI